jgi:hypothetical protein
MYVLMGALIMQKDDPPSEGPVVSKARVGPHDGASKAGEGKRARDLIERLMDHPSAAPFLKRFVAYCSPPLS